MHKIRYILTLVFILSAGTHLFAERRIVTGGGGGNKKTSGIIYGGFSFNNPVSDGAGSLEGQTGLAFGFGLDYKIMSQISLGIDMLYNQKTYQDKSGTAIVQYDLSFLEFPVYVKWAPFRELQFKAGPYLAGLMVSANRQVSGTNASIKGNFANDYGLSFGGWIGFWANNQLAVGVDVRYDMGLANIQNNATPGSSVKTRSVISSLALVFGFK